MPEHRRFLALAVAVDAVEDPRDLLRRLICLPNPWIAEQLRIKGYPCLASPQGFILLRTRCRLSSSGGSMRSTRTIAKPVSQCARFFTLHLPYVRCDLLIAIIY